MLIATVSLGPEYSSLVSELIRDILRWGSNNDNEEAEGSTNYIIEGARCTSFDTSFSSTEDVWVSPPTKSFPSSSVTFSTREFLFPGAGGPSRSRSVILLVIRWDCYLIVLEGDFCTLLGETITETIIAFWFQPLSDVFFSSTNLTRGVTAVVVKSRLE